MIVLLQVSKYLQILSERYIHIRAGSIFELDRRYISDLSARVGIMIRSKSDKVLLFRFARVYLFKS